MPITYIHAYVRHRPQRTAAALGAVIALTTLSACHRKSAGSNRAHTSTDAVATSTAHPGASLGLSESDAKKVLARVGPSVITLGDLADELAQLSPYERARYRSPERLAEFLEARIRFELLVLEARRRGYDKHPAMERARRQALAQAVIDERIDGKLNLEDVDEQSVANYYYAHKDEFSTPGDTRTLDQARPIIRHKIWRERRDAALRRLISELKAKADVKVSHAALEPT